MEAPDDLALFEFLRAKRMTLAKAQGVRPYVIFHDSTLLAMATERPRDLDAFARLPGVGGAKLARHAQTFLAVIAEHVEKELVRPGRAADGGARAFEPRAYLCASCRLRQP
jgi:superfamily II DNA helicase RecQ